MQGIEKLRQMCADSAKRASDTATLRLYNIDEIARFLVYGCADRDDFLQKYATVRRDISSEPQKGVEHSADALCASFEAGESALISYFCAAVCRYASERGKPITADMFFDGTPSEQTENNVAYVRNAISDDAYRMFEKAITGASVTYTASFTAACEEVYYGRVRYCILPYETSDEGTLSGFMKMIRKYELYPKCTCSVRSERAVTKFVLLGRSACELLRPKSAKKYLKITVDSPDFYTFTRLCAASAALKLRLVKSESIPVSWDDGRYGSSLTFDITDAPDLAASFLLYLSREVPDCSDKAIYVEI